MTILIAVFAALGLAIVTGIAAFFIVLGISKSVFSPDEGLGILVPALFIAPVAALAAFVGGLYAFLQGA